jgi:hypothetical protein
MQLMLPIFPPSTAMITPTLGVYKRDSIVTYLHCGVPIYSHAEDGYKHFRYITSKFILQGLCKLIDISDSFHVSYDSVKRYVKKLEEKGENGFFGGDNRHGGSCYKMTHSAIESIQKHLDAGKSNSESARLEGITEGSVRYALKKGLLKKNLIDRDTSSNRTERSIADATASRGIGTTREEDRAAASLGLLQEAEPIFDRSNNVCNAGVLFLIPALASQGLLKATKIYSQLRKGYYGLTSILLVMSFMFLNRIKCPEQLQSCKVGELGKLLGLDRVPEAKCLRHKIEQIVEQHKASEFNQVLCEEWINKEEPAFFYIDGHVRVYHGYQATLPKRFVSREKLCLAGTTEFWVNNETGIPYLVVTSELNEKLKDVILNQIVPALLRDTASQISQEELEQDKEKARFTMVFDREASDLPFFKQLWENYRIAVLTYRKAVKDDWPETDFKDESTIVIGKRTTMKLAEKPFEYDGMTMREIRKLSENGHQTSMITTMLKESTSLLAGKMFSRWSQENFFRYMVQDYDLDRLVEYGVEEVNPEKNIVNPCYKTLSYRIKKIREKTARLKAKLFTKIERNLAENIDTVKEHLQQESQIQETLSAYSAQAERLREDGK